MVPKVRWVRYTLLENYIRRMGCDFQFKERVPLSAIKDGLKNRARIDQPMDEDVVLQYAIEMAENPDAEFYAVVLAKIGRKYDVLDGNHRILALIEASDGEPLENLLINAYIVDTDDAVMIESVKRSVNRLNGKEQAADEAAIHCMEMLEMFPHLTIKSLARQWHIKEKKLGQVVNEKKSKDRMVAAGINPKHMAQTTAVTLNRIDNEAVFASAAACTVKYGLTLSEVQDLVKRVNRARREDTQLEAISHVVEQKEKYRGRPQLGHVVRLRRRDKFLRALKSLLQVVVAHPTLEQLELTAKSDVLEALHTWENVKDQVDATFERKK